MQGLTGMTPTCMLLPGTTKVWEVGPAGPLLEQALWAGHEDAEGHRIVVQQAFMQMKSWQHGNRRPPDTNTTGTHTHYGLEARLQEAA